MTVKTELPFPRYVRKGECLRCGWCCLNEDPPCLHLEQLPDGKYNCKIHKSKERPLRCKLYPSNPPITHLECGYYFIDKWDNNKIVRAGDALR